MTWFLITAGFWAPSLGLNPDLALTDQFGGKHDFTHFPTTYTVLNFSASWSGASWQALPELEKLAQSFPQFAFFILNEDEDITLRDVMVSQLSLSTPVIWDKDHRVAERIQPNGLPATLILDQKGQIVYQHTGFSRQKWQELSAMLEKLLNPREKTR